MSPSVQTPTNDELVPVARLSTSAIPGADQFELWHEAAAPLFDTVPVAGISGFTAGATCYLLEQLVFTHVHFDRMRFTRSSRHLGTSGDDCISLQYYRHGSIRGQLNNGTDLFMAPDRISLQDFSHGYSGVGQSNDNFGVIIPRHLIVTHSRVRERPMFSWPLDSPQGQLLGIAITSIFRQLPQTTQSQAPALASGFLGLLNGLLAAEDHRVDHTEHRWLSSDAMRQYLSNNLHNPNLGVEDICRKFRCSRATVYRLFADQGGVKTCIRHLRLARCCEELALASRGKPKMVRTVAEHWGFTDASHFHRLFKGRYGVSPSEMLGRCSGRLSNPNSHHCNVGESQVQRLRSWLERH